MNAIPIIDGHIDLAWNAIALGRQFDDSVTIKQKYENASITDIEGKATVGYPEARKGGVRVLFSTIWVETANSVHPSKGPQYTSILQAKKMAQDQYNYYIALNERKGIALIVTEEILNYILHSLDYRFGIIPMIEGADFISSKKDLMEWIEKGIHIVAPIWQKNQFGGCSELGGSLTHMGKRFIQDLGEQNVIIDIAHMSDESAYDTFASTDGIIIDSHTSCRHFVCEKRMIDDSQIMKIHEHEGVIGLMTWDKMLNRSKKATIDNYIDQMCHIALLTGCTDNIAIGSSMDGGYGAESLPEYMENIGSLRMLQDKLLQRGFHKNDIENILFKNWERVLKKALPN